MKHIPTISRTRLALKAGKTGTFRLLKAGEEISGSDILISDCNYDFIADSSIGEKLENRETIIRLEFNE